MPHEELVGWNIEKIVKKGDYLYAIVREHPNRTKNDYVLMHRVVMENHLKRLLNTDEVVHHIDGNKHNNDISNLEVYSSNAEHAKLHADERLRDIVECKCPQCGNIFTKYANQVIISDKQKLAGKGGKYGTFCSRTCNGKFSRYVQLYGLTPTMKNAISVNIQRIYRGKL